jgi:hypothetical protein
MPKQQSITTYSFSELDSNVQQNLIDTYEVDPYWDDQVIDDINDEADLLGIHDFNFRYTGFWSQGDGASFTGILSAELITSILKKHFNENLSFNPEELHVSIERKSYPHYVHDKTVYAAIEINEEDISDEDLDLIENLIEDWKDNLCQKWYTKLERHYDSLSTEAHIVEIYEDLDAIFLENGRIL